MKECLSGYDFQMNATLNAENIRLLHVKFNRLLEQVQDWSNVFDLLDEEYRHEVEKQFDTEGMHGGHKWVGLSRLTIKDRKRKGYPPGPILVRSGYLRDSLLGRTSESINVVTPREWIYGTNVPYAIYHQSDKPRTVLPRRAFLVITRMFRLFVIRKMHHYAIKGWV